jgi:hypothetical protein
MKRSLSFFTITTLTTLALLAPSMCLAQTTPTQQTHPGTILYLPNDQSLSDQNLALSDPMLYTPLQVSSACYEYLAYQVDVNRTAYEHLMVYFEFKKDLLDLQSSKSTSLSKESLEALNFKKILVSKIDSLWNTKSYSPEDVNNLKFQFMKTSQKYLEAFALLDALKENVFTDVKPYQLPLPKPQNISGDLLYKSQQFLGRVYLQKMANLCTSRVQRAYDSPYLQSSSSFKAWSTPNPSDEAKPHKNKNMLALIEEINTYNRDRYNQMTRKKEYEAATSQIVLDIITATDPEGLDAIELSNARSQK